MFQVEIKDDFYSVTDSSEHDTLSEALKEIEDRVKNGINVELITLRQEITFKIQVKATTV